MELLLLGFFAFSLGARAGYPFKIIGGLAAASLYL
jgi:hypothetical protein